MTEKHHLLSHFSVINLSVQVSSDVLSLLIRVDSLDSR